MGYFDFLEEQEQEDPADEAIRKMRKSEEIGKARAAVNPSAKAGEPGFTGPVEEPFVGPQQEPRQESLRDVERKAQEPDEVKKSLVGHYQRGVKEADGLLGQINTNDPTIVEDFHKIRKAMAAKADPSSLADDFTRLSMRFQDPTAKKMLADQAAMFQQAADRMKQASQMAVPQVSASPAQVDEAKRRVAALAQSEAEARERLKVMGVTNPERKGLENTVAELSRERTAVDALVRKYGPQEQLMDGGQVETLSRATNSAGVPVQEFYKSVLDATRQIRKNLGEGFDPKQPVNFSYALPYAIQAMGPEAMATFVQYAEQERNGLAAEQRIFGDQPKGFKATLEGMARGERQGPPEQRGVKQQQPQTDYQGQMNQNIQSQRQLRQQLAEAQELQSWSSVIAYVVLSMVLGPRNAFLFFSKARQKGTLRGELYTLNQELRQLERREHMEKQEQLRLREEATRERWRSEDKEFAIRRDMLRHQNSVAKALQSGKDKSIVDKLDRDYKMYFTAANREYARAVDPLTGQVKDKAALKRYQDFQVKADEIELLLWRDSEESQRAMKEKVGTP